MASIGKIERRTFLIASAMIMSGVACGVFHLRKYGFWRLVGASFDGFIFDTFAAEIAHAAGTDPRIFRAKLAATKYPVSETVSRKVGEMSGWTGQSKPGIGREIARGHIFGTAASQVVEMGEDDGLIQLNMVWVACDVGTALDPAIIEARMISGAIDGMSAASMGDVTFEDGQAQQSNVPHYNALRMHTVPELEVATLENGSLQVRSANRTPPWERPIRPYWHRCAPPAVHKKL